VRVGAARVEITPPVGTELSGFVMREQPSTGLHSRLYARALWLKHERRCLLWIHADVIGFGRDGAEKLRERLAAPDEELILTATHTHSGPPTLPLSGCGSYADETDAVATLAPAFTTAAEAARRNDTEATVWLGSAPCSIAVDRRQGMPVDGEIHVVGFRRHDTTWAALLGHYAVHPVSLDAGNRLISGDIHGLAALELESLSPAVLMLNGACGDLNPSRVGADPATAEGFASQLAQAARAALDRAHPCEDDLAVQATRVQIPCEDGSLYAKRLEQAMVARNEPWARRSAEAARSWQPPDPPDTTIRLVQIGTARFACLGLEVFREMQHLFPATRIVGYSDATVGYLAPRSAYEQGGYEVDSAFVYYRQPRFSPSAFDTVASALDDLMRES
jgi:neutral ceramidase